MGSEALNGSREEGIAAGVGTGRWGNGRNKDLKAQQRETAEVTLQGSIFR